MRRKDRINPHVVSRGRLAAVVMARSFVFSAAFAVLMFLPAGTWHFQQAWVFGAFYLFPIVIFMLWLAAVDPQTLERRLERRETTPTQRKLIRVLTPFFVLALMAPGFDYRFGWTRRMLVPVPWWLSLAADLVALGGMLLAFWTIYVNRFAARTIRVEEGQHVITSGPYRLVRHPMYSGLILSQVAIPVALASLVTLPLFLLLMVFYVLRLLDEEKVLRRELPGYSEYCRQTRYHLVPLVW